MNHLSIVQRRGAVPFPAFTAERVYMREIRKDKPLPVTLSRWQATVDAMLAGVDTDGPVYLMIDQGVVPAGAAHRRPGLHIDGYWNPAAGGHGGGRHSSSIGLHDWLHADFRDAEALILAADVQASRAMCGAFSGQPGDGGDCSHIDVSGLQEVLLEPGTAYAGNVTMLHESLPLPATCRRTLVRLSVPGWTPEVGR